MKNNSTLLQYRLLEKIKILTEERDLYENRIFDQLAKFQSLVADPAPYISHIVSELATDTGIQKNLLKTGIHFTADYLIDKYLPKDKESFLSGLVDNLSKKAGNGASGVILNAISSLLSKKK